MTNWKRRLEFASLAILTWIIPIFFIIGVLLLIFYGLPLITNASLFYSFLMYSSIFILFLIGIKWNTR